MRKEGNRGNIDGICIEENSGFHQVQISNVAVIVTGGTGELCDISINRDGAHDFDINVGCPVVGIENSFIGANGAGASQAIGLRVGTGSEFWNLERSTVTAQDSSGFNAAMEGPATLNKP